MEDKIIETTEKSIKRIINEGLNTNNLEHLYKLVDIYKDAKEVKNMYGNYDRKPMYDSYGDYYRGDYGRRGYDIKYRGNEDLDRMYEHYGRYMGDKERYGTINGIKYHDND